MKTRTRVLLVAIPVALVCTGDLLSKVTGILPNTFVAPGPGQTPINVGSLTRTSTRSCGQCHVLAHGGVNVTVAPTARSILVNQSTAIAISGTSATGTTHGGFCADVTAGSLVAGATTRINAAGTAITHINRNSRSWSFNWRAPATGGLAELYTVVNCVDGGIIPNTTGDSWSFHGSNPTATVSTPVRLYANATPGIKPTGNSCSDGFGNFSVLGAPSVPSVGNSAFRIEGFGMPPLAPLLFMLSIGGNVPGFDMAVLGAPGCVLRTGIQSQAQVLTGPGNRTRAEGSLSLPIPIPNDGTLRGLTVAVQFGFIDSSSNRSFPFTVTNGLEITIQ